MHNLQIGKVHFQTENVKSCYRMFCKSAWMKSFWFCALEKLCETTGGVWWTKRAAGLSGMRGNVHPMQVLASSVQGYQEHLQTSLFYFCDPWRITYRVLFRSVRINVWKLSKSLEMKIANLDMCGLLLLHEQYLFFTSLH